MTWSLDPEVVFLNHGSFGACPLEVLAAQTALRERMEREPVLFLARDYQGLLDAARVEVARFVGAPASDLVFVPNTTTAVSTVLRSLDLEPGDELLTTTHVYGACRNALEYVAERTGARVVYAPIQFPLNGTKQLTEPLLDAVTSRTRLALIDHVTSPTALMFPVEELVREIQARGVDVFVDGAHAPGMVDVDLSRLGAAYWAGNLHKWVCAPKGAALLYVRPDRQGGIRPLAISHGATAPLRGRSRFQVELDWTGTDDPTAVLAVPAALAHMGSLVAGGWPALREQNHAKVLAGRRVLCERLGIAEPTPAALIGSMATLPLPPGEAEPLQRALWEKHHIEVPVMTWNGTRLLRVSAQLYNRATDYERLAAVLPDLLQGAS
jgi:isopenicillin-N epimerase